MSARRRLKELTGPEDFEDGVLFADSPAEKAVQENSKRERRRRKIIKELFETEKAYLNHLDVIHKFFYFPLQFNCIIPEDAHSHLFSNIEQIRDVNRTLLELMEQSTVGQAFRHLGPFLKLYATYANNHEQALAVLQEWTQKKPEFVEFIAKQESRPEIMGLRINALLITPVQRIPRYKLLLEDLLEHTPIDHHDYLQLKEATQQIGEIAMYINEHIRQHENFQKMLAIQKCFDSSAPKILQPGRLFLKEGQLKKVTCKEESLVLFSEDTGVAQSWSDAIEKAIRWVMTPVNHHVPSRQDESKDCCSPHLRQRLQPFQARLQNIYSNFPAACASPPKPKVNRSSVISEGSETTANLSSRVSENSQSNLVHIEDGNTFDVYATHQDLDSMAGDFSPKINGVNASLGSTMSTATGVEIYYPHGSVLSLNTTQPRVSVRSKLKSYLRKPFTRRQRAHQQTNNHCSPPPQRNKPQSRQNR
ncbi:hypothetical protein C0Q70_04592 [Pomacea canaliculata]|uniref:DH domain-containing protein n=1 Tax=Pomacea canaliculata TaxID=400727 RepID=A0A2T7PIU0_POMCA|nr:hypothetical protein C0Q70_04592 [Pomacea canaliculata]